MESRSEEERGFTAVLERVESHYKLLSEKVAGLDQKIDRGLYEVRRDMMQEFGDLKKGIAGLVKEVRSQRNGNR